MHFRPTAVAVEGEAVLRKSKCHEYNWCWMKCIRSTYPAESLPADTQREAVAVQTLKSQLKASVNAHVRMRLRARSTVHLCTTSPPGQSTAGERLAHRVRDKRRSQKKGNIRRKLSKTLGEVTTLYQEKLTTVAICKFLPALRPTCLATPFAYGTCQGKGKRAKTRNRGGGERGRGDKKHACRYRGISGV